MSDCIPWEGTFHEGYPTIGSRRAHRVMYEAERGPIPPGHVLHHVCETQACVNVTHLRAMTPRDHMRHHRQWEASHAKYRERTHCKYGHPLDGVASTTGRRFCRECRRQDVRARYRRKRAIRRLAPMLPQSPVFAQALAVDESTIDADADLTGSDGDGNT